jgi:hypothetical protein
MCVTRSQYLEDRDGRVFPNGRLNHNASAAVTVTCAEREGSRRSDRSRAPTVTANSKHLTCWPLYAQRMAHAVTVFPLSMLPWAKRWRDVTATRASSERLGNVCVPLMPNSSGAAVVFAGKISSERFPTTTSAHYGKTDAIGVAKVANAGCPCCSQVSSAISCKFQPSWTNSLNKEQYSVSYTV